MSAYTVSRLALDAGVSVHIVRDYLLRGLLRRAAILQCSPMNAPAVVPAAVRSRQIEACPNLMSDVEHKQRQSRV